MDFAELKVSPSLPLGCSCLNVSVPPKRSENIGGRTVREQGLM